MDARLAADFRPATTVVLCKDTGITAENKPYFESNGAMLGYFQSKAAFTANALYFQRGDERQYTTLDVPYEQALECDALYWYNDGFRSRYFFGLITGIEWVNPNTTRVFFEVDPFCSYCGDIKWQPCYVEREHVENDWNGVIPNFNNIGVPEEFSGAPVLIDAEKFYDFKPDKYIVLSPYGEDGNPNFQGTVTNGVYSGLTPMVFDTAEQVNAYLLTVAQNEKAVLDNIAGVLSVDFHMLQTEEQPIAAVSPPWLRHTFNNSKVFSSAFCSFNLEGLAGETKTYLPELMTQLDGATTPYFKCNIVGGNGGIAAYIKDYKGSDRDVEDAFIIADIPQGVWVGSRLSDNSARIVQTAIGGTINEVKGAIKGVAVGLGAAGPTGAMVSGAAGMVQASMDKWVALNDLSKHRAMVGGTSNAPANLACGLDAYRICARWYISTDPIMKAADSYFDRFGYKVAQIKIPNRNTRPFWNYVKTVEAHIGGNIPAMYREAIEDMLNSGVTFWNTGAKAIGDFSNPEGNKA